LANWLVEFGEFYKFCEDRQIRSQDFTLKNQQKPVPKKSYGPDESGITIFLGKQKLPSLCQACPVGLKEIFLKI
jgi:hypothetical protein